MTNTQDWAIKSTPRPHPATVQRRQERALEKETRELHAIHAGQSRTEIAEFENRQGIRMHHVSPHGNPLDEYARKRAHERQESLAMGVPVERPPRRSDSPLDFYELSPPSARASAATSTSAMLKRASVSPLKLPSNPHPLFSSSSALNTAQRSTARTNLSMTATDVSGVSVRDLHVVALQTDRSQRSNSTRSATTSFRNNLSSTVLKTSSFNSADPSSLLQPLIEQKKKGSVRNASFSMPDPAVLTSSRAAPSTSALQHPEFVKYYRKSNEFRLNDPRSESLDEAIKYDSLMYTIRSRELQESARLERLSTHREMERRKFVQKIGEGFEAAVERGEPYARKRLEQLQTMYGEVVEEEREENKDRAVRQELGMKPRRPQSASDQSHHNQGHSRSPIQYGLKRTSAKTKKKSDQVPEDDYDLGAVDARGQEVREVKEAMKQLEVMDLKVRGML